MILADTLVTSAKGWVPGSPAETVYRPNLTKPDPRDVAIADLRRLLHLAHVRLARADELLAQAARNITTAELHHMGIDWMTRDELAEAIPPAFTRYIGERWMYLESRRAA